jgi:arylsulfatase A-like enzyme
LTLLWTIHPLHSAASVVLAVGLATRFSRFFALATRREAFRQVIGRGLPLLGGAFVILAACDAGFVSGVAAPAVAHPRAGSPNVLLVVLDTVRADRTSLGGGSPDATPNLARLAQRGVSFDNARAPSSWTLPTHASLLTGRWPFELSVRTHGPLDDAFPTLGEYLGQNGYDTAGFVANTYFCNSWYGLSRGFHHYEDFPERDTISFFEVLRNAELGQRLLQWSHSTFHTRSGVIGGRKDAGEVNREFLSWLDGRVEPSRPFFAFLNYFDAHDPYLVADPNATSLGIPPADPALLPLLHTWHSLRPGQATDAQRLAASEAYDRCLTYLDAQLGRLFDSLERTGVLDETLVIVTSDHGEQFGEHGLDLHGNSLYRPLVGVPLVIVPPAANATGKSTTPSRVADPVSLRDLPATIAAFTGLADDSPFPGRSLGRFWREATVTSQGDRPSETTDASHRVAADSSDPAALDDDPILSEVWLKLERNPRPPRHIAMPVQLGPMRSLVAEGLVYIRLGNGHEELYDLEGDPDEQNNLAERPEYRDAIGRFRRRLEQIGWF